ncbi:MAG: GLPGLI family protein [Bacteroidia bacterium]|nr:GLPGLI family protein [Bacteroidia bacterium]
MKWIPLCLFLGITLLGHAQPLSGEIVYEEKVNLHLRIPPGDEQMKAMIPNFRTHQFSLKYYEDVSLYTSTESGETAPPPPPPPGGGGGPRIVMMRPQSAWYLNQASGERIEQRDFMGRKFLIRDSLPVFSWKLTGRQQEILGHMCQEAVFQDSMMSAVAWFCPDIPLPAGPEQFGQLPGMIQALDINQGERVITAVSLKDTPLTANSIQPPVEGKEVTREEFRAMVDAKMKEMQGEMGGGGNVRMIRRP